MIGIATICFGLVLGSLLVAALHPRWSIPQRLYHAILLLIMCIGYGFLIAARVG